MSFVSKGFKVYKVFWSFYLYISMSVCFLNVISGRDTGYVMYDTYIIKGVYLWAAEFPIGTKAVK